MEKQKRIPKRRFREFLEAGEWEERHLESITEPVNRKNTELVTDLPLTISSQYGLVDQMTFFNKQIASRDLSNYYLIKKGEFAYNKSYSDGYPWGSVKRLDMYEHGALSILYIVFKLTGRIDSEFMVQYFATNLWHKQIEKRAAEGARNHGLLNISPNDFFDICMSIPVDIEEQAKIGDFCRCLDTLISLHQQKLSKLKNLKQAYLTEMFPAPGEKRPRRRFKGFSGDWKKSKFGDVVTQADIKVNPWQENVDLYSVTIEDGLIAKSDRYNRESLVKKQDIFSLVCPRQIVYNPMNMTLGSIGYNANNFDVAVSGYYTILSVNDGIDPYYFYTYMKLRNTLSVYSVYATGSLKEKQRLQFPTLVGIPCILPELEEQKKIAHVASLLDERIIKAKNSLEKLQSLKQAYLSELFV